MKEGFRTVSIQERKDAEQEGYRTAGNPSLGCKTEMMQERKDAEQEG